MQTLAALFERYSDAQMASRFGRSRSYWCHVRNDSKPLSRPAALAIWRAEKVKFGPLANLADGDVRALARIEAAP